MKVLRPRYTSEQTLLMCSCSVCATYQRTIEKHVACMFRGILQLVVAQWASHKKLDVCTELVCTTPSDDCIYIMQSLTQSQLSKVGFQLQQSAWARVFFLSAIGSCNNLLHYRRPLFQCKKWCLMAQHNIVFYWRDTHLAFHSFNIRLLGDTVQLLQMSIGQKSLV